MKIKTRPQINDQRGFSHVFVMLLVVVLVAIFGTYYVVQSRANTSNYPIMNANGKCLNNQHTRAVPKNPIEIYSCTGKEAQQWTIVDDAIVNANGYCLAANGITNGRYVVIQRCDKNPLQRWTVDRVAKTIVSQPSGRCLDVVNGSSRDKAYIQVNNCNGSLTQRWTVQDNRNTPPTINSFTAKPATVAAGQTSTLSWSVTGDGTCSVAPGGPTASSATSWTTGALQATTTFTLSCSQEKGVVATKTAVVTVSATTPPTGSTGEKFGASAPASEWSSRVANFGGTEHIKYRRIYYTSFTDSVNLVKQSIADGITPVISYKTGKWSWSQVASGAADADLQTMIKNLNSVPGAKFVAIHHEPAKDGTEADWANMQLHALPIIKRGASQVSVGVIGNGWWWSKLANGLSDAEIAKWLPANLIAICDVVGADTYEDVDQKEDSSVKIASLVAWSKRVGGVKALGIGEWNGQSAASITRTMNAIKKEPLVKWALVWDNDDSGVGLRLSGARLDAFKAGLATTNPL